MEAINAATGTIKGMSENITKRDGTRATMNDIRSGDFKVNNDFYVSGNMRAGFNRAKSSTDSHMESAVVTTMKPLNENSSITYNNVNNITYLFYDTYYCNLRIWRKNKINLDIEC